MLRAAKSPPHLATLILLTAFSTLSLNMFLPSLAQIAQGLNVDYSLANLSITGYLGITALLQLIIGPLSDRFGRRPIILGGLIIFTIASLGCALSTNIWSFLVFRIFQGVIISGFILSLAIIRDTVPEKETARLIAYVIMAMATAPMLGPVLGGFLDALFGWRASFYFYLCAGVSLFILCWFDLGETNKSPSKTFVEQVKTYPQLFRSKSFWGYSICMAFATSAFYAFLSGAPLIGNVFFSMTPALIGISIGSITAGFIFGTFISARFSSRYALSTQMILGQGVACVGLFVGLMFVLSGTITIATLFGATLFVGIRNGLAIPSCNAGVLSVRPQLAGTAVGLAGALTVGTGTIITLITGAMLTANNGAYMLLLIMLASSFVGLLAAFYVRNLNRGSFVFR